MYLGDCDSGVGCDGLGCMSCDKDCGSELDGLGYTRSRGGGTRARRGGGRVKKTGRMTRAAYIAAQKKRKEQSIVAQAEIITAKKDMDIAKIIGQAAITQKQWNKLPPVMRKNYRYTMYSVGGKRQGAWKKIVPVRRKRRERMRKAPSIRISKKPIAQGKWNSGNKSTPIILSSTDKSFSRPLGFRKPQLRTSFSPRVVSRRQKIALRSKRKMLTMQAAAKRRTSISQSQKAVQARKQKAKVAQAEKVAVVTKRNYKAIKRNAEVDPTITNLEMASDAKKDMNRAKTNLRQVKIIGPEGQLPTPVQRKITNPMTPMTSVEEYDREPVAPVEQAGIGILPVAVAGVGAILFFFLKRKRSVSNV